MFLDEDITVESSQSSSLIQMSVVDSGPGVRRSSVVVIEHVDVTPVPSADLSSQIEEEQDINTHIFVWAVYTDTDAEDKISSSEKQQPVN